MAKKAAKKQKRSAARGFQLGNDVGRHGRRGKPRAVHDSDGRAIGRVDRYQLDEEMRESRARLRADGGAMDGWINQQTGMGVLGKDKAVSTGFTMDVVASEDALELWRGDPIAARIIETMPTEALRQGYELHVDDDNQDPEPAEPERLPTTKQPGAAQGQYQPGPSQGYGQPTQGGPVAPGTRGPSGRGDSVVVFRGQRSARVDAESGVVAQHLRAHLARWSRRYDAARNIMRRLDAGDAKRLQETISRRLEKLQATAAIKEAMQYERAYGGGAVLIGANDYSTDLREPLDLKKVRSLDYLTPLEARELIPIYYYNDPRQPKYGQPAIYQMVPFVVGASVTGYAPRVTQVHESRLIAFGGIRVSRRVLITGTLGWGDSVLTRAVRSLRALQTGYQNAETLIQDFAQAVYKKKKLADLIQKDGQGALRSAMMNVEISRSIARAVIIDADEEFERKSTTMAGYPETLDRLAQNAGSGSYMPLTLMLGQSPKGLGNEGDSDIRFFYDQAASVQVLRVAPALLRLCDVELATLGEDPEAINYSVSFKPLWQPTEHEIAQRNFIQSQADANYLDRDVCSPEEIAHSRFGGDKYSLETRIDFGARAAQMSVVHPTVEAKAKGDPGGDFTPPPGHVGLAIGEGTQAFQYTPDPEQKGPMPKAAQVPQNRENDPKPGVKIQE